MRQEWFEEAKFEFADAARYYQWEEPGLEHDFIKEIGRTIAKILEDPECYREFDSHFRKLKTERFPYQVIYAIDGEAMLIVAIMHQSRKPGYWKDRL